MHRRSWFRLLPGMDWYSRIRSGDGRPTEPRVEFLGWALGPQGRSVAGAAVRLQLGASSASPTRTTKASSA